MSSNRRSNRRTPAAAAAAVAVANNNDNIEASGGDDNDTNNPRLQAMRERSRAVAEREASRLARPDVSLASRKLGHASKTKSAVSSTPFGQLMKNTKGSGGTTNNNEAQEWCGPFSVARQMIAAREDARRLRLQQTEEVENDNKEHHPLDHVMEEAKLQQQRKENPSMNWISRRHRTGNTNDATNNSNYYVKRRKRFHQQKELMGMGGNSVPSLFQLCINYLVDNFDHVDSLGLVDHSIRVALCERLVAQGKMNGAAFDVLAEEGVETLELVDCAQVTQDQFCDAIKVLIPMGLRAILLQHCGRCFGGEAVNTIVGMKSDEIQLFALSLSGAFLLSDDDLSRLIGATSRTLSSIDLTACPLIGPQFCNAIGEHFSSSIGDVTNCLLELSLEDIPLKKEALLTLGAASNALRNLKSLKLKSIEAVDDEVVEIILNSIDEGSLEGIDLSSNSQLTDEVLSSIRRRGTNLRSLQLSGLRNLSAIALEAFFTPIDDLPSPPMLRKLDLSHCSHDEINDAVVMLAAKASSFRSLADAVNSEIEISSSVNPENLVSEITNSLGLVHVNVSGSSISDKSMEMLAATCKSSLEELDVGFCAGVSDNGLGYLVSKVARQLSKIHVWGCAQITEDFLDGHDRLDEGGLEIVGVWMKKSGGRSLR
mmetsp:Transcript_15687/g.23487  ORF Transcript_15687/g.23487 Transcript_15687/m.23487 type:complete len:654 (+) Transcript_15687:43-2004(+)